MPFREASILLVSKVSKVNIFLKSDLNFFTLFGVKKNISKYVTNLIHYFCTISSPFFSLSALYITPQNFLSEHKTWVENAICFQSLFSGQLTRIKTMSVRHARQSSKTNQHFCFLLDFTSLLTNFDCNFSQEKQAIKAAIVVRMCVVQTISIAQQQNPSLEVFLALFFCGYNQLLVGLVSGVSQSYIN